LVMSPSERVDGNSVYFDPQAMSIYAKVYTYGAAAWVVFMIIMQAALMFAKDPREKKDDNKSVGSARMLIRHHETNKNSNSNRDKDVETTQTATEEMSRKTERTQE
ncbi:hypothetical protein PFISCL1PPCAC_6326, partial [Pristionchus fissidentatus]